MVSNTCRDYAMIKEIENTLRVGRQLAEYVTSISFEDLPENVVHQAKRVVLDSLGTMFMGSRKEEASGISAYLKGLRANKECTIIGEDFKTSCRWAAFANASYAQVHDCNDGHRESAALGGDAHPGRVAIPTAVAVGEKLSESGKDVLAAIVVGYDIATRIRGIENRPPSAAYCSAAISSKLLGLDEDKVRFALGIAGHNSPSSFPGKRGYDTNFLSNGYSAKVGIEAAMLAGEGLNGPPLGDDRRLSTRFSERGLGKEFEIMNVYIKPYPTCRMTHGAVDAILGIKSEVDIDPSDVEEVTVNQVTHGMYIIDDKVDVDSYYKTCQFNLPYIVACAIIDGEVGERQFTGERISDPAVHELAGKIKVVPDEDLDAIYPEDCRPTLVEIKIRSGETHSKRISYPKGDPRNPLTDDELFEKFLRWAGPSLEEDRAREIRRTISRLDRLDDISEFTELLSIKH
jgi:2-methylcitrate dehydratase PrpD